MADQPLEPRVTVDLPVRVYGMTAEGRAFSQSARAQNISSEGALLSGIESELKVGEIVGVQCEDKKARCSVVWAMNTGAIKKNQVGVKLLDGQECPWKSYLTIEGATIAIVPSNRRRFHRHKISMPLELRDERIGTPMRITATDVSGNGCYVETIMPLPAGTVLRAEFYLDSERVSISAVVRTCDPGVGNGIEFTGLPPDGKQRMQDYLDAIDPEKGISKPGSS
jgi:PilZ domain-containing protein